VSNFVPTCRQALISLLVAREVFPTKPQAANSPSGSNLAVVRLAPRSRRCPIGCLLSPSGTSTKSGPTSPRTPPATADRLVDDIIHRFDLLAEPPGMGRARPEFGIGVRSVAVANYVIYYRQEGNDVLIARVLHGRRDQIAAWSASS
jgi:plasmid stabilization system protein ParE